MAGGGVGAPRRRGARRAQRGHDLHGKALKESWDLNFYSPECVEGTSEHHNNADREVTGIDNPVGGTEPSKTAANRIGLYSSILTVVMTVITFGLAITAVPNSGAGCLEDCLGYPYLDTLSEYPGDYLWMPPAMILVVVYVVLVASIHAYASPQKKVYAQIGLSFALIAAGVLLGDYFVQFSVVPVSLMNGQTEGIAL